jgi:hypothetical protein
MRAGQLAALLTLGFSLIGCEGIRQATGAAKLPPDEFTVLTKSPLIIPPDFNLRPPQPGVASRNEINADDQGRAALFSQTATAASLGTAYSDGEKLLLTKTNALAVDPNIRRNISSDIGQDDQGPGFAQRVLYSGTGTAPQAAPAAAPAAAAPAAAPAASAPMPNGTLYEGTGVPLPTKTPPPAAKP